MLKARVKYIGRRAHENNGRYAEIITPVENTNIVSGMLRDSGYTYSVLYEDCETVFMVNVDNMNDYKVFMNGWKKAKKKIDETKMHKYKVALNVDGIVQVTYTVHAYSSDGAVYRAKVKAFDDFGESKFNSVYVEEVKGGENK